MIRASEIGTDSSGAKFRKVGGKILTECFGLQCTGFDSWLYASLRQRFAPGGNSSGSPTLKRKSSSADVPQAKRIQMSKVGDRSSMFSA